MSREGIVERAEAPELRRPSPIWKWLFLATLLLVGFGVLGALLFGDLESGGVVSKEKEDEKSRLSFKSDGLSPPTFAKPEPELQPVAPVVEPAVPEPRYRRRSIRKTVPSVIPLPVPGCGRAAAGGTLGGDCWRSAGLEGGVERQCRCRGAAAGRANRRA